ncbi:class I SAM-dependent DNA methyltransferase [Flavobacterium gawalongense]|uniref:Class I SAM-dependent methyltransferase n=1 Tax=Flavobacterium gawalongense TaxID=2594432 RepID=A0A553BR65_9FLAO|nr:class I SAM-dependent methyltransferase [Flavobacterium gawalongense]TRX03404.1 class I SAM-dependent methyltransferase [Flavobacterium gawalongense]TRX06828.1 class I SAM-dependent methyltransferase [Flavobacterium gawalongense]TRX10752.1 class I SAM-dependent methyltransferase [Flavobacterium gawalongense]TRX11475.1 class I SAM-dependent methyltransferase [Flavobacterium gawalongense]TRX29244.1 class I SAM-dependent methyltransferase [Flavobacterium gawalongense]
MTNLYDGKMAAIFDAMYQTFIDYDEEYQFYNSLIQEYHCKTILEIGSGTGNLAKRFQENHQDYIGLDYSQSMIAIAKERNKNCTFIHGDMREFELEKPVDSIIITGRSTSYLISNDDVNSTFDSIYKNLNKDGMLIFDFIDANRFIPFIKENEVIIHEAEYEGIKYYRNSNWKTTLSDNFMLEWTAQYYTLKDGEKEIIADDFSTVRVFTLNEIQLFLYLNGFEIIKTIDRKTYAYDTYVIVAKKNKAISK